jgi:hypothetical protein
MTGHIDYKAVGEFLHRMCDEYLKMPGTRERIKEMLTGYSPLDVSMSCRIHDAYYNSFEKITYPQRTRIPLVPTMEILGTVVRDTRLKALFCTYGISSTALNRERNRTTP